MSLIRPSWKTCLFRLIIGALFVATAFAQGIHTTLRSQTNPYGFYQSYASVWGDGHYAYIGSERRNGVLIYDISNPDAPVLASYYAPSNSLDMEDVKVSNGVGFFADNMGSGLHIVDVSDPTNPQLLTQITSANGGYDNTHKITVWENFLFIAQNLTPPAIIKVFDISSPATPVLKTTITATDPKWINDVTIQDNGAGSVRMYTAGWGGNCDIWDITNIATQAPVLLGSFSAGIDGSSSSATADGNYLAYSRKTTDGTSEVKIYNISNPASVTVASTITMSGLGIDAVAPHDPKIMGNLLYVSWYQAGTLIFDITNPAAPVMVGSYDTWPGTVASGQLDGNWGVYPYLGQDRVLLSDRNTGLYIVDTTGVNSQAALYNFKVNPASVVGPLSSTATVYLLGIAPGGGAVASLSSNNSTAVIPPTATVAAGATSAAVTVTTTGVATKTTATLTATYASASKSTVLTITPEIPSTLKFVPTSLVGGLTTVGTVTMAATASMDTTVNLTVTSGSSAVALIPASVTVPAGSSTATFNVVTKAVSSSTVVKVSAAANGTTVTGQFTVTLDVPTSLSFSPSSLIGGGTSTGTVTLSAAAPSPITVILTVTAGSSAVASIPPSVTVAQGATTATFALVTKSVTSKTTVTVSAAANGTTKTANLTVNTNPPTGVTFTPNSVFGGASSTGKVTFAQAVTADTTVTLTILSGASAIASMPTTVVVPSGSSSATWTVVTAPVSTQTTVQISAAANGGSKTGTLTVKVNTLSGFTFTPNSVVGGQNSTGKVTFSTAVANDTVVTLSIVSGASAIASIPSTVTVLAGTTNVSFTVVTASVSTQTVVQVSATAPGTSKTANLTVKVNAPSALSFSPATVTGGKITVGKVTFTLPVAADTTVALGVVSGSDALASMPSSIVVPAGSSNATFNVTTAPVSVTTTLQISATAGGVSKTANITVQ